MSHERHGIGTVEHIASTCNNGKVARVKRPDGSLYRVDVEQLSIVKPAHDYPTSYASSSSEIEWRINGHPHICGSAKRTGLTVSEEWPVYKLHSFAHPTFNGVSVILSPDGFVLRPTTASWNGKHIDDWSTEEQEAFLAVAAKRNAADEEIASWSDKE